MKLVLRVTVCLLSVLAAATASAQVQTGSISGVATDTSNAVMPGVTVSLSGDKLIGGVQVQTTDATGAYRFDRLPPGTYNVKFELQGFRAVDRSGIAISASFIATVNAKLEVGGLNETITVTGESPTVDTHSNLQQTVMNQEILEGVPVGPRSLVAREDHPRRAGVDVRRRRHAVDAAELAVVARVEHQRRQLQHRRRVGELARRRRRRDDALLRPGHVRRGQLHDLGDPGRDDGRRRLHQHGDQGRRQQVARRHALQLLERLPRAEEPDAGLPRERQHSVPRLPSATRRRRPGTSTSPAAARS